MNQVHDSHTFLAVGLASCIVLSMAAFGIGVWNAYWHTRIKDQVEQVVDAATPSFAEDRTDEMDLGEEMAADARAHAVEVREIGGRVFSFAVGSAGDERQVAVRQTGRDAGEDVQDLRGRRPPPHATRTAPRPPLPHLPQRREAP